jgi:hypothetical protein
MFHNKGRRHILFQTLANVIIGFEIKKTAE